MTIKFSHKHYIDLDEGIYIGSTEPFDIDLFTSDPKGYLDEIIKETKNFVSLCNKIDYYDNDYWTMLNSKFTPIIEDIKSKEQNEKGEPNEYYNSEIRKRLKGMSQYSSYLREKFKEKTKMRELAESFNPVPKNEVYTKWILGELNSLRIQNTDKESTLKYLKLYDSFKNPDKKSIVEYDIHTLRDYLEQVGLISNLESGSIKKKQRAYLEGKMKDCKIIYDSDVDKSHWTVYEITSIDAAMTLASNTEWCTRHDHHAKYYLGKSSKNLIAFYKNKRPYAQLALSTGEFKDQKDVKISSSDYPPYRLQDPELYKVVQLIDNPNFTEVLDWNNHGVPFKDLVLQAFEPTQNHLQSLSKYKAEEIHNQMQKELIIKRYKILEPKIFESDAPYMLTEAYMKSWGNSEESLDKKIEKIIVDKPNWALSYACNVIKGPWPEAEPAIFKSEEWDDYLRYALKITIEDYIKEKFLLENENFDEIKKSYNRALDFSFKLKDYQRKNLKPSEYVLSILISNRLTDYILIHCIDSLTDPSKYLEITLSEETQKLKNLKIKDSFISGDGQLKITELTQKIYDYLESYSGKVSVTDGVVGLKSFCLRFMLLPSKLDSNSFNLINTMDRDTHFEDLILTDLINVNRSRETIQISWLDFINKIQGKPKENSWQVSETTKNILNKIFQDSSIELGQTYSRSVRVPAQPVFYLILKYFIYSSYYSQELFLDIFDILTGDREGLSISRSGLRDFTALMVEKAILNNETSNSFWCNKLFDLLEKSVGKAVILSKKDQVDPTYLKTLISEVPEHSIEINKLLNANYKRVRVVNKKSKENLSFVEILSIIDNVKIPNTETIREAFLKNTLEENRKVVSAFCEKNSTNIFELISKLYKKNVGFIELFDLLKEGYISTIEVQEKYPRNFYYNPILSSLHYTGYELSLSLAEQSKFLSKIKNIPDFKIWVNRFQKEIEDSAEKNKDPEPSKLFYAEEKALMPDTIEKAFDDLRDAQFIYSDGYDSDRYDLREEIINPAAALIMSTSSLTNSQLTELMAICPGLFVNYINTYDFSSSQTTKIDKLICQLIKQAALFSARLETYSENRRTAPGLVINMFITYLAKYHSSDKDPYILEFIDSFFFAESKLIDYINEETFKNRLIREIKRFNK